jgi:membrane protein
MNNIFYILSEAIKEWLKDDVSLLAAALAYYGLFSFVPLLILTLIFINSLFSYGFLDGQVVATSQDLVGRQVPGVAGELIDWSFRSYQEGFSSHLAAC